MTTSTQDQLTNDFYTILKERHSVRHYDNSVTISEEEIKEILEAATVAPSSSNSQSWRFLVVTDPELKQQLLPIANNQQQVVDASAVVVVLGDLKMYELTEQIYDQAVESGFVTREIADHLTATYNNLYTSIPEQRLREIIVFDAGLVSMQIMLVAKQKGYDTVPMGGFDRDKLKAFFNMPERYTPLLVLPIGKAAKPAHKSPRLPIEQITFFNKM